MEYKYVELLTCAFVRCPDEVVQDQITYRYNAMKQRLALMQTRVHEIVNLVKTKNPSLLLQLQKGGNSSMNVSHLGNSSSLSVVTNGLNTSSGVGSGNTKK